MTGSSSQENRKIGIAIATYNKCDDVVSCIKNIVDDDRVESITIIDDCSEEAVFILLEDALAYEDKVRLGRNDIHIGEELNKHRAILLSDSEYVLCVNPSTVITTEMLDYIFRDDFDKWENTALNIFVNRKKYLQDSPYSKHSENVAYG